MRKSLLTLTCAAAAAFSLSFADAASAACTRLGFSVNDYGKDGPTRDAKQLLDKYIAKWAGEHAIAKYTTGKKDVTCELFLDFIVFDEYTCRAEASVCWDGAPVSGPKSAATTNGTAMETGSVDKDAAKAPKSSDKEPAQ